MPLLNPILIYQWLCVWILILNIQISIQELRYLSIRINRMNSWIFVTSLYVIKVNIEKTKWWPYVKLMWLTTITESFTVIWYERESETINFRLSLIHWKKTKKYILYNAFSSLNWPSKTQVWYLDIYIFTVKNSWPQIFDTWHERTLKLSGIKYLQSSM